MTPDMRDDAVIEVSCEIIVCEGPRRALLAEIKDLVQKPIQKLAVMVIESYVKQDMNRRAVRVTGGTTKFLKCASRAAYYPRLGA